MYHRMYACYVLTGAVSCNALCVPNHPARRGCPHGGTICRVRRLVRYLESSVIPRKCCICRAARELPPLSLRSSHLLQPSATPSNLLLPLHGMAPASNEGSLGAPTAMSRKRRRSGAFNTPSHAQSSVHSRGGHTVLEGGQTDEVVGPAQRAVLAHGNGGPAEVKGTPVTPEGLMFRFLQYSRDESSSQDQKIGGSMTST